MLKYENNAKYYIKHWLKITCVSPEFPPKTSHAVISKMLEALNLKNNAETRYRCQVSVYRTIGPLVVYFVVAIFDLATNLESVCISLSLTANSIWKPFLKYEFFLETAICS